MVRAVILSLWKPAYFNRQMDGLPESLSKLEAA
jgi:hypothetical protein